MAAARGERAVVPSVQQWRERFAQLAATRVRALPSISPVDLVHDYFRPWSSEVAFLITDAPREHATRCQALAATIFEVTAAATSGTISAAAQDATVALATLFTRSGAVAGTPGNPEGRLDASLAVQAFVALSESLPALLANAWQTLLAHPAQLAALRASPGGAPADPDANTMMPTAVNELLRYAGPARAVFREAHADVMIGAADIRTGDRVIVMLSSANRDPLAFVDAEQFDVVGAAHAPGMRGHVALGAGAHRCVGASLVRMAMSVASEALLGDERVMQPMAHDGIWRGGFAIAAPARLLVRLVPEPPPADL